MGRVRKWMIVSVLSLSFAEAQTVTKVVTVRIDGRPQRVRQINGRWWSEDNRQLTQSKDVGWLWWLQGKRIEEVKFFHHQPVDLAKAESLHLFMDREEVRSLLGDPNETFEDIGRWTYYAADGTALSVRFLNNDHSELGDARYERSEYGVSGRRVASIEQELDGRKVFKVFADRAWQRRSPESYANYYSGGGTKSTAERVVSSRRFDSLNALGRPSSRRSGASAVVEPAAVEPAPVAQKPARRIPVDLLKPLKTGMTRSEVIRILGEPNAKMQIAGSSTNVDVFTYELDSGGQALIELEAGKVVRISQ